VTRIPAPKLNGRVSRALYTICIPSSGGALLYHRHQWQFKWILLALSRVQFSKRLIFAMRMFSKWAPATGG